MEIQGITVKPLPGKDYKLKRDAQTAWEKGEIFQVHSTWPPIGGIIGNIFSARIDGQKQAGVTNRHLLRQFFPSVRNISIRFNNLKSSTSVKG